ncbi:hypothetical protein B0T17DRAFT_155157 [Bombardia bombarda]|uniref:RBR-type E3 ubiquitin transferase n=1 Tax=Bombardia bombarda TaxID=252184 RepID=A0AA39X709_9PEZI|nr:hypothetical protein B0T17DRAFT_155157 [Bombardia bombarda]
MGQAESSSSRGQSHSSSSSSSKSHDARAELPLFSIVRRMVLFLGLVVFPICSRGPADQELALSSVLLLAFYTWVIMWPDSLLYSSVSETRDCCRSLLADRDHHHHLQDYDDMDVVGFDSFAFNHERRWVAWLTGDNELHGADDSQRPRSSFKIGGAISLDEEEDEPRHQAAEPEVSRSTQEILKDITREFMMQHTLSQTRQDPPHLEVVRIPEQVEPPVDTARPDLPVVEINGAGEQPDPEAPRANTAPPDAQVPDEAANNMPTADATPSRTRFDCAICMTSFDNLSVESFHLPCGHVHCEDCIRANLQVAITSRPFRPMKCCARLEPGPLRLLFLRDKTDLQLYRRRLTEFDTKDKVYCWDPRCNAFIPTALRTPNSAKCPQCLGKTCLWCKGKFHFGPCSLDGFSVTKQRTWHDEALVRLSRVMNWQQCPECKSIVERTYGCDHIICICGCEFCYKCGVKGNGSEPCCDW